MENCGEFRLWTVYNLLILVCIFQIAYVTHVAATKSGNFISLRFLSPGHITETDGKGGKTVFKKDDSTGRWNIEGDGAPETRMGGIPGLPHVKDDYVKLEKDIARLEEKIDKLGPKVDRIIGLLERKKKAS